MVELTLPDLELLKEQAAVEVVEAVVVAKVFIIVMCILLLFGKI